MAVSIVNVGFYGADAEQYSRYGGENQAVHVSPKGQGVHHTH